MKVKRETIIKSLTRGKLTPEEIAEDNGVSLDVMIGIQRGLTDNE